MLRKGCDRATSGHPGGGPSKKKKKTIGASLRSGRGAVNPAGRAGAELALYSACKGGARAAPRWPFPEGGGRAGSEGGGGPARK
jgi:hypothetical protein